MTTAELDRLEALLKTEVATRQFTYQGGEEAVQRWTEAASTANDAAACALPNLIAGCREAKRLRKALKALVFMAETSGGTAGPDKPLQAAIEAAGGLLKGATDD